MYDIKMLKAKKIAELIEIAEQIGIKNLKGQKKQEIIDTIVGKSVSKKPTEVKSESDKKSTEVKLESDKKPIHTKSESDKKPIFFLYFYLYLFHFLLFIFSRKFHKTKHNSTKNL